MTSDEKRMQADLQALAELCQHMTLEYDFTQEEFHQLVNGWLTSRDGLNLPVIPTPYQTFVMLATVARAIKFGIVVRPPKVTLQ